MVKGRALHFVFKIGNRIDNAKFYRDILGMKYLRHEEFDEGCKASCNGPYDGKWSKSMVGYGPEDNYFVVELTYNYGIDSYKLGNDFRGITISSPTVLSNAKNAGYPMKQENGYSILESPDGYKFYISSEPVTGAMCQNFLNLNADYWTRLCGMKVYSQDSKSALLSFDDNQCKLELVDIGQPVDHATAFGRIAFSCPAEEQPKIQRAMEDAGQKILNPLLSLDTPGKATVQVVILADPDGHEICFVCDEGFRVLSQIDPKADQLHDEAVKNDKSSEWFAKKGLAKGN
ncbi:hypothetical protein C0Q70_08222 [Pomacea canaliculata]|uniref:VOC domain-containing protein n=1 Tax=Pomacea canaliculata TaxID=400727 RepID=A0A2T7PH79_POMCA|nr:hypothetical protein C0Q70_08222 [Pomacea canaliculata]